jgi:NAD+ diphosphatase
VEALMVFTPAIVPPETPLGERLYFVINHREMVLVKEAEYYRFPTDREVSALELDFERSRFIGYWGDGSSYAVEYPAGLSLSGPLEAIPLREVLNQFSPAGIQAVSVATQVITWDKTFRFCGQCGQRTKDIPGERAKVCNGCGLTNYPRLSPSIIVSVVRDNRILLARSPRFPNNMYSVLAGFVEPGETLEECVQREVREEVGIEVANIRYFGSQNWPFPHSMMIGFTAEHAHGEIKIDDREIVDARWFAPDEVPRLPGSYSIARRLIDDFINGSSG